MLVAVYFFMFDQRGQPIVSLSLLFIVEWLLLTEQIKVVFKCLIKLVKLLLYLNVLY